MTKFLNISTDNTLGGSSPSDEIVSSQKAIKEYIASAGTGANTSLSNLTTIGQNIGNWSSNVTNCITEIPQDIKLELNNGTLTLKAGSKVYVPNGAGNFDVITIASDITKTDWGSGNDVLFLSVQNGNYLYGSSVSDSGSGTSTSSTNGFYYRTDLNAIYPNNNTSANKVSFPIVIVTKTNGVPTSIDQVFNGFGYIGSTVFALPGLKGLCPDKVNTDGTLKNYEFTISDVKTRTFTNSIGAFSGFVAIQYNSGDVSLSYDKQNYWTYNKYQNIFVHNDTQTSFCYLAGITTTSAGVITSFSPSTAFRALDYNNTEFIAHQSMPSGRYINLTLGSSGTNYTAPADGYVTLIKAATNVQQYIELSTGQLFANMAAIYSGQLLYGTIPVSKGASFQVNYNAGGSTNRFRFTYTNGAQ